MKKLQKLLWVVLTCVMAVSFSSCNSEEDEPLDPSVAQNIVGTWKGHNIIQAASDDPMCAKFYEDGTCEIWWYQNPLLASYYFTGEYTMTKKKLHLKGLFSDQGSRPHIEYDRTADYTLKGDVLKFRFDLTDWTLTRK